MKFIYYIAIKNISAIMPYGETKVYTDGAYYIAIPHITNPKRRKPPKEEMISVLFKSDGTPAENVSAGGFAVLLSKKLLKNRLRCS